MDLKDRVRNDVLLKMQYHLDSVQMDILGNVLVQVLAGVEVVEMQTLPATVDNTNDYILQLFQLRKATKLSPRTVEQYFDSVRRLICSANKPLTKITSMDVELFLNSIKGENNPTSLNNQRRNLSAFFNWMRKNKLIVDNPCDGVEPYKEIQKPIDHMEPEEAEQLKDGCKHPRDRALIEFLRSTAVRVGECVRVNICDIDWRTGEVQVYGEKTRAFRPVFLDSVALKYIGVYVESRGLSPNSKEPLFASVKEGQHARLSTSGIRSTLKTIKNRAELERRVYPHLFRKTTATNIRKRGGSTTEAGDYLGHVDKTTAGKHYAAKSNEQIYDIFKQRVAAV